MSNLNHEFDFAGVALIFKEVQELEDKEEKTAAEYARLANLEKVQDLALEGVELANELLPIMKKLLKEL